MNKDTLKKLLKPEYGIILIIILTGIYFISSPFYLYKDGELYRSEFTRIEPAQLGIVNRNNLNEYFIAQRASTGFYAEFHDFDGTIQSIHEISGATLRNIGHPFSTSLWVGEKAYFSGLRAAEKLVVWEVDFNEKKIQEHFVKNLNILSSLQDTMIIKHSVSFFKPRINNRNKKDIDLYFNGSGYRLLFSESIKDSIYSYFNYELLEDNTEYQKVKEYLNKHLKPDKDFLVYDVFEIISFFNRRNFYFKKYFANINPPCAPVSQIYLLDSFDANEDGNKDLLIRVCHNRFYNDNLICYDVKNDKLLWERNDFHNVKNVEVLDLDRDGENELLFSTYSPCNEIPINFHDIDSKFRNRSYFCILNAEDGSIKEINNKPALIESPRGFYEFRYIPVVDSNKILLGLMARSDFKVKKLLVYDYKSNLLDTLDIEYTNLLGFTKENGKIVVFDNPLDNIRSFRIDQDFNMSSNKMINADQSKLYALLTSFVNIDSKNYNLLFTSGESVLDNSLKQIAKFSCRFRDFTAQSINNSLFFIDYKDDNFCFSRINFIKNRTINPIMINMLVFEFILLLIFLLIKQSIKLPILPIKDNYFIIQRYFGFVYIWRLNGVYSRFFRLPRRMSFNKKTAHKLLYDISDKVQEFYTHSALFVKTKVYKIHTENELSIIQRISHDLKNQIMMIKLQMDEYTDRIKRKQAQEMGSMLETIKEISVASQTLSNFSQINQLYKEKVEINSLIDQILAELQSHEKTDCLQFQSDHDYFITIDKKLIKIALKNLIANALDAIKNDQQIIILVKQVDHLISIIIKNPTEITQEEFEQVEGLGFTTKKTGSGLGIPISRSIIEKHNGKFQIVLKDDYFIVEIYLPYES
jgi:signal transduction histidine kinase